ncbi:MAG: low molecular weight protein-tyrosine-phosphatase [Phaeodactylibacter sp.]|uniref:low molecular weight protein-tyrosine-phosphatase n=1 Tax=Phaeodactylibacter sp. TaxID=1940289 RepID=UPI0032F05E84
MKILMVCLGNICRSPLAQGILEQKAAEKGLNWSVDSAGTGSWHIGESPDPRSVYTAGQHGLDISGQRARQFRRQDLQDFDLILAMDQSNYQEILRMAQSPEEEEKVRKILDFTSDATAGDVPDPYWDDDGFEKVYQMLDKACDKIIATDQ